VAYDLKYGEVTLERGEVPKEEPVFIFRAQDKLLPEVLAFYLSICVRDGSPPVHLKNIEKNYNTIRDWQEIHFTKLPESASGEV